MLNQREKLLQNLAVAGKDRTCTYYLESSSMRGRSFYSGGKGVRHCTAPASGRGRECSCTRAYISLGAAVVISSASGVSYIICGRARNSVRIYKCEYVDCEPFGGQKLNAAH